MFAIENLLLLYKGVPRYHCPFETQYSDRSAFWLIYVEEGQRPMASKRVRQTESLPQLTVCYDYNFIPQRGSSHSINSWLDGRNILRNS